MVGLFVDRFVKDIRVCVNSRALLHPTVLLEVAILVGVATGESVDANAKNDGATRKRETPGLS